MKVILSMTITTNGIIATSDYGEDFSSYENWNLFIELAKKCGCLIWGRKTYEKVQEWEPHYLKSLNSFTKIIVSKKSDLKPKNGFIQAKSPEEALSILKKMGYKKVILTGGSKNNASFAKLNLIDEINLNVEPAILGKGIPLFDPFEAEIRLKTLRVKKAKDGIIQLHYKVLK